MPIFRCTQCRHIIIANKYRPPQQWANGHVCSSFEEVDREDFQKEPIRELRHVDSEKTDLSQ
jgi:hypothetical protein